MKLGEADKILQDLEKHYDIKKTIKESMEFPVQDQTQLFGKFATPEFFEGNDSVTRENATGNLSSTDFKIIVATGSIRSNFIRMLKKDYPDDANILKIIDMIGDDIIIRATTSKSLTGWLGNLIITSKRLAEITTGMFKDEGKKLFGLRR
jgi:hypothetical protein